MSTPINLATEVYPGPGGVNSAIYSSGKLIPDPSTVPSIVILHVPVLGAGGSGVIHVTGTFNAATFGVFSALAPDSTGWSGSTFYTLWNPGAGGSSVTQTFDFTFGAGVEQYDDAITAGEDFVALNPLIWSEITAISYDYSQPGGGNTAIITATVPPRRLHPRDDGQGTSTAPRMYPPPRSNRLAGGYL